MKQIGFAFNTAVLIFLLSVIAGAAADCPAQPRNLRDPFAPTPVILDYLGINTSIEKRVDMMLIRMKGFMEVKGKQMAIIEVKNAGTLTVCPGTRVELEKEGVPVFIVSIVTPAGVMVTFKDGEEVWYEYE